MFWLAVLSFNAVYTLIPIIIIVALIAAGAGLSRNTDFFALMGFGTILGAARPGGGVGRGFGGTKYGGGAGKRGAFKKAIKKKGSKKEESRMQRVKNLMNRRRGAMQQRNASRMSLMGSLVSKNINSALNKNKVSGKKATAELNPKASTAKQAAFLSGRVGMAIKAGIIPSSKFAEKLSKGRKELENKRATLNKSYRNQVDFNESLISKKTVSGKPKGLADIFKDSNARASELKKFILVS